MNLKMMHRSSGRPPLPPANGGSFTGDRRHLGVICSNCEAPLGDGVRYMCLDCQSFDLCADCESDPWALGSHFKGEHIFAKIRDSTILIDQKDYQRVKRKEKEMIAIEAQDAPDDAKEEDMSSKSLS